MVIGVLTIELYLGGACSLKDKRRILKSLLERIKNNFNVSIAELGNNDLWQRSTIGIACLSNTTRHIHSTLSNIVKFIEKNEDVEIMTYYTELF